uniref:Histone H4 n=1 Tax=Globodera rostochiensis TaxID=31243 RepID=A0A914HFG6_GLORO
MSGHGTGATGTGQQGARRQRKVLRDSIKRITKPSILRLARRAGVTRINERVYEAVRAALRDYLSRILRDAAVYCEHARRKTMKSMDVIYALRRQGNALYGHGP